MILIDSSVWIDYFRGTSTLQTEMLEAVIGHEPVATGDLILAEVLQGFRLERDFNHARRLLTSFIMVDLGGQATAIQAAKNFRVLRALGIAIRKTIDTVIATHCIQDNYPAALQRQRLRSIRSPPGSALRAIVLKTNAVARLFPCAFMWPNSDAQIGRYFRNLLDSMQ